VAFGGWLHSSAYYVVLLCGQLTSGIASKNSAYRHGIHFVFIKILISIGSLLLLMRKSKVFISNLVGKKAMGANVSMCLCTSFGVLPHITGHLGPLIIYDLERLLYKYSAKHIHISYVEKAMVVSMVPPTLYKRESPGSRLI